MSSAWDVLAAAGVPIGPLRPRPSLAPDERDLRAQLEGLEADTGRLASAEKDALRAWLCGFQHHWPVAFARTFGECGPRLIAALGDPPDRNRHIKLRRIAIENLSGLF
jgi:hypothetical protein